MRKGQISVFIIVGIILVIGVVISLFFTNVLTLEKLHKRFTPHLGEGDVAGILGFINNCVKTTALEGIASLSNLQTELKNYIQENTKFCIGEFKSFEKKGYNITKKAPLSVKEIVFSSQAIFIVIKYPLQIKKFNRVYEFDEGYTEIPLVPAVVELVLAKPVPPLIPAKPIAPPVTKPIALPPPKTEELPKSPIKRPFDCPFVDEKFLAKYCSFRRKVSPLDTGLSCLDTFLEKRPYTIVFLTSFLETEDDAKIKYEAQLKAGEVQEIKKGNVLLKELGGKYYLYILKDRVFSQIISNTELCENVENLGEHILERKLK